MQKTLSLTIVLAILAWTVNLNVAHAQTYQDMGNGMIIGSDGSMSQEIGNGVLITPAPFQPQFGQPVTFPRQTFCQRVGNTVICN